MRYVFTQRLIHAQIATKSFLKRETFVLIQNFPSPSSVSTMILTSPIVYLLGENNWIHAFPKDISVK